MQANEMGPEERYARQVALPEVGPGGQRRLQAGRVLVIGVGGLGSPVALYLAAAGVGTIGLVDSDTVAPSNLQRQVLYDSADTGRLKVDCARERLAALNPGVDLVAHRMQFSPAVAADMVRGYDFVIDASDNFPTKFLVADVCHRLAAPYSHAGVLGFMAQAMTVLPGRTACYRCVFDAPPSAPPAAPTGPMGYVPGVIGSIQAGEALRFLLGAGSLLTDRLLRFDGLTATFRTVVVGRQPGCRLCGAQASAAGGDDGA
jgi:molybdopterin/thiamine biosynthesis adenylyltransferase